MGYMKIPNLYKDQRILYFKECYALEKIHGTSAHISFKLDRVPQIHFFSGGEKYDRFVSIFDNYPDLLDRFLSIGQELIVIYGEAYGGKQQGMGETYGDNLGFVAFDVKIGESWFNVPDAEDIVVRKLGLEFVAWDRIPATIEQLDKYRDLPSVQAIRNGITTEKPREGIVIRPIVETSDKRGNRIITKHKAEKFQERTKQPKVTEDKLQEQADAIEIMKDWVTPMRLNHVLDKLFSGGELFGIEDTGKVIGAMLSDIETEGQGEIKWSGSAKKLIGRATAKMFHELIKTKQGR